MINTNATVEQLEQLKLNGMAQAYRGALLTCPLSN